MEQPLSNQTTVKRGHEHKNISLMRLRQQKQQLPRRMIFQKGVTESPHKFKMIAYDPKSDINYQNDEETECKILGKK